MAIAPTGAIFKSFTFDGIDSRDFGVYISGDYVYNSPERDIETVEIPGRNGAYIMDKGRFHNITVTYPAGMFASNSDDFAEGIRQFRNALASRKGYCRLTDQYHPLEYRMAVYRGGLEVEPAATGGGNEAAQFDIVFECKPQRYLIQGDEPRQVASGAHLNNPTLFESSPLLQVWGYGDININDNKITIPNSQLGAVTIGAADEAQPPVTLTVSGSQLENGDTINISRLSFTTIVGPPSGKSFDGDASFTTNPYFTPQEELSAGGYWNVYFEFAQQTFVKGTASNKNTSFTATYGLTDGTDNTVDYAVTYSYDGDSDFTFSVTITPQSSQYTYAMCAWPEIIGNSTQSSLGTPLYIDLEIGEAYKIENDVLISVNNSISIPAKLPKLKPGANVITYDNTVTSFVITPRWWEV